MFSTLKTIHVSTVIISGCFFLLRGVWMLFESPLLQQRWVRIVPHVVDSVLLASAIALTVIIQQYPFVDNWLSAKVIALLGYIVLGTLALKRGKSKSVRVSALLAAVLTFSYILIVALYRQPVPFLLENSL